jgi:uncharacterized protein
MRLFQFPPKFPVSDNRACDNRRPNRMVQSWAAQPLILLTCLTSLGGLAGVVGFTQPANAQPVETQSRMRTLSITGMAQERVPTTITLISLGVAAQGKTAQEVQQEMARRSSAVLALLRSRNVERLETSGISLSPSFTTTDNGRQKLLGYTGSNTISFRLPTERVGDLLDASIQAGATSVAGVSFVASEEAIAAARQRVLRRAALEAQSQAQTVLSALGLPPGQAVNIAIDNARELAPQPIPALSRSFTGTDLLQARLEVVGGQQQVQATVSMRISY